METELYNSYLEVDLDALDDSFYRVKAHVGEAVGIIPVLKSNAYGHGLVEMARFFALGKKVGLIAVSQLIEAVAIRRDGMADVDILILGGLLDRQIPAVVEHGVQPALFDCDFARKLSAEAVRQGRTVRVQVKIETGMGRIGVKPGAALATLLDTVAALPGLEITGFFTHFATAESEDEPYAREQHRIFLRALAEADARSLSLRYVHCCNTGGTTWFREAFGTHVRAGCIVLGIPSMNNYSNPLGLREALTWRAAITFIHWLEPGGSCGYERFFTAQKRTRVAIINVGYGDGLYRPISTSGGPVIVGDTRTRFLAGCMDQCIIDVTDIDCAVGDEVTLIGQSRGGAVLSINELSEVCGQTSTMFTVTLNDRIERRYVRRG